MNLCLKRAKFCDRVFALEKISLIFRRFFYNVCTLQSTNERCKKCLRKYVFTIKYTRNQKVDLHILKCSFHLLFSRIQNECSNSFCSKMKKFEYVLKYPQTPGRCSEQNLFEISRIPEQFKDLDCLQ